jgi:hypothetical protein
MTSIPGNHANQLVKLPEGCPQVFFIIPDNVTRVKHVKENEVSQFSLDTSLVLSSQGY